MVVFLSGVWKRKRLNFCGSGSTLKKEAGSERGSTMKKEAGSERVATIDRKNCDATSLKLPLKNNFYSRANFISKIFATFFVFRS